MRNRKSRSRKNRYVKTRGWGFEILASRDFARMRQPSFERLESRWMLAGAATLTLSAQGALTITEAAGTSDSLTITESSGNFVFTNTAGFASASGPGVAQQSADVVNVSAAGTPTAVSITLGGVSGNGLSVSGSGSLTVNGNIIVAGVDVVSQSNSFSITATGLSIDTTSVVGGASHGTINLLDFSNSFTFAAKTDGGSVNVGGDTITVGTVGSLVGVDTTDGGAAAAGADAVFGAFADVTLGANINAGQANAQFGTITGAISESSGVVITAGTVAAISGGGAINLGQSNSITGAGNSAGVFAAASTQNAGQPIIFGNAASHGLEIGSISLTGTVAQAAMVDSINSPLEGISVSNSGSATSTVSVATLGSLTMTVSISGPGGVVELAASGGISESSGATVVAGKLVALAGGGNITLAQSNTLLGGDTNFFGVFAAADGFAGGSVTLINTGGGTVGLEIGSITLSSFMASEAAQFGLGSTISGITTNNGAVNLTPNGFLDIAAAINAGSAAITVTPPLASTIVDQGFESESVGGGNWQYAPTGSWLFTGTAGVSGNGSAITFGNPLAPQGSQVGFIQFTGSISQTITLAAGTYTLDLLAAQRGNFNHGGQSLQVLVDGTAVGSSITPSGTSYLLYNSASFTVTAGPHTITLAGLNPHGGDNTALVDQVSVQAAPGNLADTGFETESVGGGNWQYAPSGSPWTYIGTAGVSGNGSAITAGNPLAPQGSQVAFIQGTGSINQTFNMSAGTYTVSFLAAQRGNFNNGGQGLEVFVDGGAVGGNITPTGTGYLLYNSGSFTVAAGPHTIAIAGVNPHGGDNTALVDAISVRAAVSNFADAGFETASVGNGAWQYAPSGSSWTFANTAGVSGNFSAITAGNPVAPQGSQVGFIQNTGSISQSVVLAAGTYTVDFGAAQRGNFNHGGQNLQVFVDGSAVGTSITPTGTSYAPYISASFTATAGAHAITIVGLDTATGDNTALVDEISVQPVIIDQFADNSFEAAAVGNGNWQYGPTGSPWIFNGTVGASGNFSAITAGNPTAPNGSQVGFIQNTGSISQAVVLTGGTYGISFQDAQRGNFNHGGQNFKVLVDGNQVGGTFTPAGTSYALQSVTGLALSAGTHTISFVGLDTAGGDNTALIDLVSLSLMS